ncbi:MAG TPA: hypothetical protein ENG61_00950 [Candidatus Korarchaeota archaeon]|nr:hypothetical protein [Candidatus Korarchaeota archaeon]
MRPDEFEPEPYEVILQVVPRPPPPLLSKGDSICGSLQKVRLEIDMPLPIKPLLKTIHKRPAIKGLFGKAPRRLNVAAVRG